jgi:hypothetical protein
MTGAAPAKTDLKREIETYTAHRGVYSVVLVPPLRYLAVDGRGDPNTAPAYADALAALYPVAYRVKFLSKTDPGRDYTVMPLEALWWAADPAAFTTARDKSRWEWTLLTLVPGWISAEHVEAARAAAARKSPGPAFHDVRLEHLDEGLSVQTLHVGPYEAEGPVLEVMHADVIPGHGLRMRGRHHEIYLNDARRTPPEKLRTILRQPVEAVLP